MRMLIADQPVDEESAEDLYFTLVQFRGETSIGYQVTFAAF